jgi:hypothetical protein
MTKLICRLAGLAFVVSFLSCQMERSQPTGHPQASATGLTSAERKIANIAANSSIARYSWKGRKPSEPQGVAPIGYIKGMALVYARLYCRLQQGDRFALRMARAEDGDRQKDALAHYHDRFRSLGMSNSRSGADVLRHLFVLLIGLGMHESSGVCWEGVDVRFNQAPEETEAGLFQASWNSRSFDILLVPLFHEYDRHPVGLLEVFNEGVRPGSSANRGSGDAARFQYLTKHCPSFAVEFIALAIRGQYSDWQPVRDRYAEVHPDADMMLKHVEDAVNEMANCGEIHW